MGGRLSAAAVMSVLVHLLSAAPLEAATLTVTWDANPEPDLSSYVVHIGTQPGTYTQRFSVPSSTTSFAYQQAVAGQRYCFAVSAVNSQGAESALSEEICAFINTAPTLVQPPNQTGETGVWASLQLVASDAEGDPLSFSVQKLPPGLSLDAYAGRISGTPTTIGTYSVTASVSDGRMSASRTFTWTITAKTINVTLSADHPSPQAPGRPITFTASAVGGVPPYSYEWWTSSDGGTSWTPLQAWTAGASSYTWSATSAGSYKIYVGVRNNGVTSEAPQAYHVTSFTADPKMDPTPPQLVITSHANNQQVGSAFATLAGTASDFGSGGTGIVSVLVNGQPATGGTAVGDATASWNAPMSLSPGANLITVQARDGAGNVREEKLTLAGASSVRVDSLVADFVSPQQLGATVTFTANASSGTAPYQFKWLALVDGAWRVLREWEGANTLTWVPEKPATYGIWVWARSSGVSADAPEGLADLSYTVVDPGVTPSSDEPPPVSSVWLGCSQCEPQPLGSTFYFRAEPVGGQAPYEFKYLYRQGNSWRALREWAADAAFQWAPSKAGTYEIAVWARSSGSTRDSGEASASVSLSVYSTNPGRGNKPGGK